MRHLSSAKLKRQRDETKCAASAEQPKAASGGRCAFYDNITMHLASNVQQIFDVLMKRQVKQRRRILIMCYSSATTLSLTGKHEKKTSVLPSLVGKEQQHKEDGTETEEAVARQCRETESPWERKR